MVENGYEFKQPISNKITLSNGQIDTFTKKVNIIYTDTDLSFAPEYRDSILERYNRLAITHGDSIDIFVFPLDTVVSKKYSNFKYAIKEQHPEFSRMSFYVVSNKGELLSGGFNSFSPNKNSIIKSIAEGILFVIPRKVTGYESYYYSMQSDYFQPIKYFFTEKDQTYYHDEILNSFGELKMGEKFPIKEIEGLENKIVSGKRNLLVWISPCNGAHGLINNLLKMQEKNKEKVNLIFLNTKSTVGMAKDVLTKHTDQYDIIPGYDFLIDKVKSAGYSLLLVPLNENHQVLGAQAVGYVLMDYTQTDEFYDTYFIKNSVIKKLLN